VISKICQALAGSAPDVAVVCIRARRSRRGPGAIQNHAQKPRGALVSMLKVLWKAASWWWCYLFQYRARLRGGGLVLFDRFYFDDLLVDPLKHRYGGPAWFVRAVRRAVPGPQFYILLDAPVEVVYARKHEVPFAEVERQRQFYHSLLREKDACWYMLDASMPADQVAGRALEMIQHKVPSCQASSRAGGTSRQA
jgi:thymidylate kinase